METSTSTPKIKIYVMFVKKKNYGCNDWNWYLRWCLRIRTHGCAEVLATALVVTTATGGCLDDVSEDRRKDKVTTRDLWGVAVYSTGRTGHLAVPVSCRSSHHSCCHWSPPLGGPPESSAQIPTWADWLLHSSCNNTSTWLLDLLIYFIINVFLLNTTKKTIEHGQFPYENAVYILKTGKTVVKLNALIILHYTT